MPAPVVGASYTSIVLLTRSLDIDAEVTVKVAAVMSEVDCDGVWVVLTDTGLVAFISDQAEPLPPEPPRISLSYRVPRAGELVVLPNGLIISTHPGTLYGTRFWCVETHPAPDYSPLHPAEDHEFDRGFNNAHAIEDGDPHA